jgi:hypothetical protein
VTAAISPNCPFHATKRCLLLPPELSPLSAAISSSTPLTTALTTVLAHGTVDTRRTSSTNETSRPLPRYCQPSALTLEVPEAVDALERAGRELARRADTDSNHCFGYFPSLEGAGIYGDLPACRAFAATLPEISLGGMSFGFNFLRLSQIQQKGNFGFHLDSDAATAVSGDLATLEHRLIRRALLNLSNEHARTVHHLDLDIASVAIETDGSYAHISKLSHIRDFIVATAIPPRDDSLVHGIDFYANRVFHSGVDDEAGHFVAGYGYEIDLSPRPGCELTG